MKNKASFQKWCRQRGIRLWVLGCLLCSLGWGIGLGLVGCGGGSQEITLVKEGKANLTVVYDEQAGVGIQEAATALVQALQQMTGTTWPDPIKVTKGSDLAKIATQGVLVLGRGVLSQESVENKDADGLPEDGYLMAGKDIAGKALIQIVGKSETGVQYGVYSLLQGWGVRYFTPKDGYFPAKTNLTLKLEKKSGQPALGLRGFHHHTQHPIPMSVYLLEPDDKHLPRVKEYLQWLVRNRQNVLQWHFLKTVDIEKWLPYVKKLKALADPYGVKLALTISFADQQQNNYRLIESLNLSAEKQDDAIRAGIDKLLEGGFQYLVVQFGTSEFTKVSDTVALRWLNTATAHAKTKNVAVFAWIHTAGELKADAGGYFYHLPEKATSDLGAYVHTTMFYDMKNPAPVYGNEHFRHQHDFLKRVNGKRPVVYFPETAWWLGFDNNLPLALPITGYSRALDLLELLKSEKIQGHVTFTTGIEWGYWKYDHYLTQVTWDQNTTWDAYLKDFASIFGNHADTVSSVLSEWTKFQVRDFYTDRPRMIFYLAGELLQDELGQQAGVLARSPKRAFTEIINLKPEEYTSWEKDEFSRLESMFTDYKKQWERLPPSLENAAELPKKLYLELYTTLTLYVWRIQHTVLLYDAVRLLRKGREDGGVGADSDATARKQAIQQAQSKISEAKAITQKVLQQVALIQKDVYRDPPEILATERKSLTSYPFGYLWETSTAFFWKRRDEQAEKLLKKVSGQNKEEWEAPAPALVFQATDKDVELSDPKHPLVKQALGPFVPGFLVAVPTSTLSVGKVATPWRIGIDRNGNGKPDAETVSSITEGEVKDNAGTLVFTGQIKLYQLPVVDKANNELGILGLEDMNITFRLTKTGDSLSSITSGILRANVVLENLVIIATQVAGLERDGLLQILGPIIGFDPKNPPRDFPFEITLKTLNKLP